MKISISFYNDWEIEIGRTTFPIEWIFYGIFELEDNLFPAAFIQWNIFVAAAQKRQSTIYCVSDFQFSAYFRYRNKIRMQRNRFVTAYYIANIWLTLSLSKTTFSTAKTDKIKISQARLPFSSYFRSFYFNPAGSQICILQCSFRFNKQRSFRYFLLPTCAQYSGKKSYNVHREFAPYFFQIQKILWFDRKMLSRSKWRKLCNRIKKQYCVGN